MRVRVSVRVSVRVGVRVWVSVRVRVRVRVRVSMDTFWMDATEPQGANIGNWLGLGLL